MTLANLEAAAFSLSYFIHQQPEGWDFNELCINKNALYKKLHLLFTQQFREKASLEWSRHMEELHFFSFQKSSVQRTDSTTLITQDPNHNQKNENDFVKVTYGVVGKDNMGILGEGH